MFFFLENLFSDNPSEQSIFGPTCQLSFPGVCIYWQFDHFYKDECKKFLTGIFLGCKWSTPVHFGDIFNCLSLVRQKHLLCPRFLSCRQYLALGVGIVAWWSTKPQWDADQAFLLPFHSTRSRPWQTKTKAPQCCVNIRWSKSKLDTTYCITEPGFLLIRLFALRSS